MSWFETTFSDLQASDPFSYFLDIRCSNHDITTSFVTIHSGSQITAKSQTTNDITNRLWSNYWVFISKRIFPTNYEIQPITSTVWSESNRIGTGSGIWMYYTVLLPHTGNWQTQHALNQSSVKAFIHPVILWPLAKKLAIFWTILLTVSQPFRNFWGKVIQTTWWRGTLLNRWMVTFKQEH